MLAIPDEERLGPTELIAPMVSGEAIDPGPVNKTDPAGARYPRGEPRQSVLFRPSSAQTDSEGERVTSRLGGESRQ
mgnify:CR=1 FL=1